VNHGLANGTVHAPFAALSFRNRKAGFIPVMHINPPARRSHRQPSRLVSLFLWATVIFFPASAQKLETPLPVREGYVNDYASVLSDDTESILGQALANLEQRAGLEFVVVTVPDTGSLPTGQYAQVLMKGWGIGFRERGGKGLLLLLSTGKTQYYMCWSSDIEADVPGEFLEQLIGQMKEPLRDYDYDASVTLAVRGVAERLSGRYGFSFEELSREPVNTGVAPAPTPAPSAPVINSGQFFKLYIRIAGMVVGFLVAVVLVIKLAAWLFGFGHGREFKPRTIILLLVVLMAPLPAVLFLYPSQTSILRSWEPRAGPFTERGFWAERVFGLALNRFHVDVWGGVTELHVNGATVHSAAELSGLSSLAKMTALEISDTPLEGTLDLTPFTNLESLDLHGTRVSNLAGLDKLTQLKTLDLSDTNITDLRPLESAENLEELRLSGLDLSRVIGMENLWRLNKLHLDRCTGVDLSRVAMLYQLQEVSLAQTDVSDLRPLVALGDLKSLWLTGSAVSDVTPLSKLKLGLLDIRGTSVKREEAERAFGRPILILYGEKDASPVRVNPSAKAWLKPAFFVSLIFSALLLWPLPRALRRRPVLVLRRIMRRMIFGVFFVLLLLALANLELSGVFNQLELPDIGRYLTLGALAATLLWLVLRPLTLLLLETKAVNSSRWGVLLLTLSRMIPWLVIALPLVALFIYMLLRMLSGATGFLYYAILITLIWISLSMIWPPLKLILPVFFWRMRVKRIQEALAEKETGAGLVLEIPFQYTSRSLIYSSVFQTVQGFARRRLEEFLPSNKESGPAVLGTFSVGLLGQINISNEHRHNLHGAIVIIRFGQLEQARPWEFRLLKEWIASAYAATWAPLWIVLDLVEKPASSSTELERNIAKLEGLVPYLSGFVRHRLTWQSVMNVGTPESIRDCLKANRLTDNAKLDQAGLNELLREAFTPVAALCRSVFSSSHLATRLDTLMRATETAVAFFVLVLVAEHERAASLQEDYREGKIDLTINMHLKNNLPEFSSWESVLNAFCKRRQSGLARLIAEAWDRPASEVSLELRDQLESVGGERATMSLPRMPATRREELTLIRLARNLMTAHGPAIERAAPELYLTVFAVALDLMAALPWRALTLQHIDPDGSTVSFRGCVPTTTRGRDAASPAPGAYAMFQDVSDAGETARLDVSRYFYTTATPVSVAMHIGEEGFFDPIAGLRV
jgi:uncharacterized membrane protein YgcG